MPRTPSPGPKSAQEAAWTAANPLLADLCTARIRELQAEAYAARAAYQQALADVATIRAWQIAQTMEPLPFADKAQDKSAPGGR